VGLLTDYFIAASDVEAASTIDRAGGPGQPRRLEPVPERCGLFRRRVPTAPSPVDEPIFPTLTSKGIDPVVNMGTLEELLTGRSFEQILESNVDPVVASADGGERLVVRLTNEVTDALRAAPDALLVTVSTPWAQTEELDGMTDPETLTRFLRELSLLAKTARSEGRHLYCWSSV
jgi:hypothetical protein